MGKTFRTTLRPLIGRCHTISRARHSIIIPT
jgi:hypothetical protein